MASPSGNHIGDPGADETSHENGMKVIKFKPRDLSIIWGNDARYWKVPEPGVDKPAELLAVCWLEVSGSADLDPRNDCEVTFNLSFTQDASGWDDCPVYIMVNRGKSAKFASTKHLFTSSNNSGSIPISCRLSKTDDKHPGSEDRMVNFGLYEVWTGRWKRGLQIQDVIVKELPGN